MKTTQEERDRIRVLTKEYNRGVPAFTTAVVGRLLDDADRCAELEAELLKEVQAHSETIRRFNALLEDGCTS